ncbi:hypothetical protein [Ruminococcus sp. YE282]|uniref:hypothetical protein n=1 Tax=Ruminococcus sp. YE282 TaxID=3158780 RepID=UPI0008844387|nr:hypothetical protein SAMN02910441_02319 [Ruminococcus bromii]
MKGKGMKSQYIITNLFATDYFHYYSTPVLFASYFLPFIAYGKTRAYYDNELKEKIINIRDNKHGNFYNYATQGFGNVAFYEPHISFDYFYDKLCSYDNEKLKYFVIQDMVEPSLESDSMKNDLLFILKKDNLLLKRGKPVLKDIKEELIKDLKCHENKYVLAKILYYIVHHQHQLPNPISEIKKIITNEMGFDFNLSPNICMGFRRDMDENIITLCNRIQRAIEIQMLFIDGISLFGDEAISRDISNVFFKKIEELLISKKDLRIEIIISEAGSKANKEACQYQINLNHLKRAKSKLSLYTIDKITKLKESFPSASLELKLTTLALPYALFIVGFNDDRYDYIKLDMYSPFLKENNERPSLFVFKSLNPELFKHFKDVFENMWKNDDYSHFKKEL